MWKKKPTKKQQQIFEFIKEFQDEHKYSPSLEEIASCFKISIPTVHQHVQALRKKGLLRTEKGKKRSIEVYNDKKTDITEIPLMGIISAGGPIEPVEDPRPIEVPRNMLSKSGKHFALEVSGRSMIEEGVFDGDIVIVREQPIVENGESGVAYLPDRNEVTLKKIYREKSRFRLQPANREMEPFYEKNVEIQGKIVGVLRKII